MTYYDCILNRLHTVLRCSVHCQRNSVCGLRDRIRRSRETCSCQHCRTFLLKVIGSRFLSLELLRRMYVCIYDEGGRAIADEDNGVEQKGGRG